MNKKPSFILKSQPNGVTFLAPRGVALANGVLAVSDTGQNRVFLWKNNSFLSQPHPDVVLGQHDDQETGRNGGDVVSLSSLQYPSGIWTDGERLVVADAWNHRVLIWHSLPKYDGQAADVVLGQPAGDSNQPNVQGLTASPTAQSLYWPYGVCSDGKSLWIADTGNRRVLFFANIPTESYAKADKVVGQLSFEEREYNNENAIWPYAVKLSKNGKLCIADTQYFRVLVWHDSETVFHQQADVIIGQQDFANNGQNQYRSMPLANTLNWCYDACFDKGGIWVADTGNSRLLHWDTLPSKNNQEADSLVGQKDFETHGEATLRMDGPEQNEMYWPFSVTVSDGYLVAADTGNHRILFYSIEN